MIECVGRSVNQRRFQRRVADQPPGVPPVPPSGSFEDSEANVARALGPQKCTHRRKEGNQAQKICWVECIIMIYYIYI